MRTSCFLGLHPPPSSKQASLIPIKPPQISLAKNEDYCWRKQFVVMGVAASYCTIIGLEFSDPAASSAHESVTQEEIIMIAGEVDDDEEVLTNSLSVSVGRGSAKWSQKRACPPWRGNALETIVPENLPRPAARRRYEAVRSTAKVAPPLAEAFKTKSNSTDSCFSM
ncbi:protein CHLOROPLAST VESICULATION-like [Lotus japonicus]|uniref:protein CHLOROPLAST VESICULATION-like n=1 Tax=Lotus japonicus TaxID=34305 RepID=UPI0025861A44|nr:protein CHLOROPLAST VESICULATION-like [Lotus japonicus]